MPHSPQRPCRYPGCPGFCEPGQVYCKAHRQHSADRQRGNAAERGYDYRWRQARGMFLREHPLCVACLAEGKYTAATVVDHILPHRGNKALFWDVTNWQPLCKRHHDEKTGHGL